MSATTCPYTDEKCVACPVCIGGQFIPTAGLKCECEGTGCINPEHREFCVHGYEKGNCVDCATTDWGDQADMLVKAEGARNAHR